MTARGRIRVGRAARSVALVAVLVYLLALEGVTYLIGVPATAVIAVLLGIAAAVVLVRRRRDRWWARLPIPLVALLGLATVSILWSAYPGGTAVGLLRTWLAVVIAAAIAVEFAWPAIVAGLARALRVVLVASWLFELFVALVIRKPLMPLVPPVGVDAKDLAEGGLDVLQWSRNDLFELFVGGRLQGVVGNATIFAILALLGLAVFVAELVAARPGHRLVPWLSIALAVASIAGAKSATATVAGATAIALVGAALLLRRTTPGQPRLRTGWALGAIGTVAFGAAVVLHDFVLELLGRDDDLTGRVEIWVTVLPVAAERPIAGHGWVGYWLPWVEPFDELVVRNGVRQLQAHNAWVDVFLQLGALGVIAFAATLVSVLWLGARLVVHSPGLPALALAALPLAIGGLLAAQTLAESRILVDAELALLVIVALAGTGAIRGIPGARDPARRRSAWRPPEQARS